MRFVAKHQPLGKGEKNPVALNAKLPCRTSGRSGADPCLAPAWRQSSSTLFDRFHFPLPNNLLRFYRRMAQFLRGKQAGIQKDLSEGLSPELFLLDDVSLGNPSHPLSRN
jgi:hypothetical protein